MSGWAPLRIPAFRRLWSAQFVSNVGSWMQTVAAQWVMLSLTGSAFLIGAISAAGSLPVLLLAIPAGALGDLIDRRRLILATQILMLVASGALAVLTATTGLTPLALLGLLFVIGCGTAISAPTWQTLQPELASGTRAEAIALGSVNQNLARAVGPAIGGALLAATSAAVVFGANALSFVAVVVAVAVTRLPTRASSLPREQTVDAIRAGARFVGYSPTLLALIARAAVFIFPASAMWALLPLVAQRRLGLGSGGYGLLLGCVGIGALAAATFSPALRRRIGPRLMYAAAAATIAATAAALAVSTSTAIDAAALVAGGSAWIASLGILGGAYQSEMPPWVKARGMAYYLVAFQGASALGGLGFGAIAQATSLTTALLVACGCLIAALIGTWRLPLPVVTPTDPQPGDPWPLPDLAQPDSAGPVLVTVQWPVDPARVTQFLELAPELRRLRRRTGALSWKLYRRADQSNEFVETFVLGTWAEHERQHARVYPRDQATLEQLDGTLLAGRPREATHYVAVRSRRRA